LQSSQPTVGVLIFAVKDALTWAEANRENPPETAKNKYNFFIRNLF
jgi:hypothetical protein